MITGSETSLYRVWAADKVVYGPVTLPTLVAWIQDERVLPDTWILSEDQDTWMKAREAPELTPVFNRAKASSADSAAAQSVSPSLPGFSLGSMRRLKLLAGFEQAQLASFVRYLEVLQVQQFTPVARVGDPGDAMFLVIEGELRARVQVDNKEITLATLGPGDFFGEISLLDHGPRSADVIANQSSVLLKISSEAFARLRREAPALALPFLTALSQSIVGRLRTLTKKYQDSIHFSRVGAGH